MMLEAGASPNLTYELLRWVWADFVTNNVRQGRKTKVKGSLVDARNGEEGKGEKVAYAAAPITEMKR